MKRVKKFLSLFGPFTTILMGIFGIGGLYEYTAGRLDSAMTIFCIGIAFLLSGAFAMAVFVIREVPLE